MRARIFRSRRSGAGEFIEAAAACIVGLGFTVWLLYPGLMSQDSAAQYAQVLGYWPLDDVHPPIMALIWTLTDALLAGPGGLFLLFAAAWWIGLVGVIWQFTPSRPARWLAWVVIGFWPPALLMLGHIWKDVGMAAALLLATALLLRWRRQGSLVARCSSLALLALACAFRHNGIFAALPLLLALAWPLRNARVESRRRSWLFAAAGMLLLAFFPTAIARLAGAAAAHPWTAVALWDIAAVSLKAERVLIPPETRIGDLSLDDLRAGYVPWANPPLFASDKIRISFYGGFSDADLAAVRNAWLDAVRQYPGAYLSHRAAMARYLLFGFSADLPRELVYSPTRLLPREAVLSLPTVDPAAWPFRLAERWRTTPLFAGLSYLSLALLAVAIAWRRRARRDLLPAWTLAVSAWANALPLLLISGSAEFRYLLWTVLAALLALAAALLPPAERG